MKKYFLMICLIFSLLIFTNAIVLAVEVPDEVRIGIYYGSKGASSVELSGEGGLLIGLRDTKGNFEELEEVKAGKTITVIKGSNKNSVMVSGYGEFGDSNHVPCFVSKENDDGIRLISIDDVLYRGDVEIKRYTDSDMTVINVVSMQEYLYGVVPREIGGNSPVEAVKAQAIIARTYATKNYNKRDKWGFDLYPTVDDQVYGGYKWENENSNRAVDETDGMVAVYNGDLIGGYYFSTSGGYTEDSENVWGGSFDYLKAVPDIYEPENLTKKTWTVTLTSAEVKQKLANNNVYVGDVLDLVPTKLSDVGRVIELKVIGTNGTAVLEKSKTRTYLGLDSQWYTINSDAPVVAEYNIKVPEKQDKTEPQEEIKDEKKEEIKNNEVENNEEEKKPLLQKLLSLLNLKKDNITEVQSAYAAKSSRTEFVFQGRGWGHAVGMSQNGAIGMAKENFDYEEIIKWYYSGVEIQK